MYAHLNNLPSCSSICVEDICKVTSNMLVKLKEEKQMQQCQSLSRSLVHCLRVVDTTVELGKQKLILWMTWLKASYKSQGSKINLLYTIIDIKWNKYLLQKYKWLKCFKREVPTESNFEIWAKFSLLELITKLPTTDSVKLCPQTTVVSRFVKLL